MTKKRCAKEGCNKKLTLVDMSMPCRCKALFCTKHRPTTISVDGKGHACTFNYKESTREKLKENMPVASFEKVAAF